MSVLVRSVFSLTMLISVSAAVVALSGQAAALGASAAWVKVPAPGDKGAMAFATINNPTMYDVYFTTGTADVAGKVEIRDKSKGTEQAAEFVAVPAYGSVTLDQNTVYLMLLDLKRPLKAGDKVALTLSTSDGAKVEVSAAVRTQ